MDILPTVDFYQKFNSKFEVEEPLIGIWEDIILEIIFHFPSVPILHVWFYC